jgi:hypothetical protein
VPEVAAKVIEEELEKLQVSLRLRSCVYMCVRL